MTGGTRAERLSQAWDDLTADFDEALTIQRMIG